MGTIVKQRRITGRSLKEAFRELQDDDRDELGNDSYSGGWNNAQGVRVISSKEFDKKAANQDISKHETAVAKVLRKPVENKMKVKTSVENYPNKGTRKWETVYVAEDNYGREIICETKQAEAIKKARAYVTKNPSVSLNLHIKKILIGGKTKVARITYKKSVSEKPGEWEILGAMSY